VLLFARLRLVVRDPQGSVPDILDRDLRVVFCGINPGRVSAAAGAHFANPRNDFWRLLHAGGFTSRTYDPQEQHDLLAEGIGITNAALRTTRGSGDLRRSDFAGAAARLERIASDLRPLWIAFVGKEAYRGVFGERAAFGVQERTLARTGLFVLPSTSPANAAVPWNERLRWFRELAELSKPVSRPAVRAVVLDRNDRALLFRYSNDRDPGVWVCLGGALEPGETEQHALRRELEEEMHLTDVEVGRWIWTRRHVWAWGGIAYDSRERIAVVRVDAGAVTPDVSDSFAFDGLPPEPGSRFEHKWWTLAELETTADKLSPRRLPLFLRALLENGPPPESIDVGV
jgi:TDG/mug DNA glycosylase family protein